MTELNCRSARRGLWGEIRGSVAAEWEAMMSGHFVPYHKLAILVAVITSFMFSIAISHDVVFEAPVAVIDLDQSRWSAQVLEKLNASPLISVRRVVHTPVDVRGLTRASLRGSWGMVLQDTWVRRASVRENIAIGRPDATDDEIVAAAKAAYADEFIRRMPHGYDTVLDGSTSLSAGQKQLLCIARVMVARPQMLILDEATSNIDTRTELLVQRAFDNLMRGRTSFVVAHRLSTIRDADAICVVDHGRIAEKGTHEELLAHGGIYRDIYESQFAPAE